MLQKQSDTWLILLALATLYVVWGSTYLANAWAIAVVPPFLLAGGRFLLAGTLMMGVSAVFHPIKITRHQIKHAGIAGLMLFALGNGLVVWALQFVDSGIASLMVAFEPLLVVLLMWKIKSDRPGWNSWLGLALGITGMLFLVGQPQFVSDPKWLLGVAAIFGAIFSWGYISIWMTTADLPKSLIQSAALQMLIGGFILIVMGLFNGEWAVFDWVAVTNKALLSFIYLVIFGSILAFTAFNYLLKKVSPTLIVTSAYVNPVIALFLGWWLNHEAISLQSLGATVLLVGGVVFISLDKRKKAKTT